MTVTLQPDDVHNRVLLGNVHPPQWKNPEPAGRYNLVVVGAGTAGLVTAAGAAGLGAKVALIEKHLMGGDCLNVGCVPSKGLIRASRAAAAVRDASGFGVSVPEGARVDFPKVMERMRRLRSEISANDSVHRYTKLGVDLFVGEGRFVSSDAVEVDGKRLHFKKAVIATGARAVVLPIPGLAEAGCLTNETIFSLTELPKRLAVIGAGPIGCEMSQAFRRFGSDVFLLEVSPKILGREDADATERVQHAFARDGVRTVFAVKLLRVEKEGNEKRIYLECAGKEEMIAVDEILLGVGRAPNVGNLGLEAAGVAFDKQGVRVNDFLQTTNPRIYAAGDLCFAYKFTHTADALARIVIQNALFLGRKRTSALTIPWCTYTDPEIAHVGMYEKDAKEKGIAVQTFVQEFAEVDRAVLDGEDAGLVKVHVRQGSDEILGATIVASHAGDMISEISVAMAAGFGLGRLSSVTHPYPTQAEAIRKAGDAYQRTRLTPFVRRLFSKWLQWSR